MTAIVSVTGSAANPKMPLKKSFIDESLQFSYGLKLLVLFIKTVKTISINFLFRAKADGRNRTVRFRRFRRYELIAATVMTVSAIISVVTVISVVAIVFVIAVVPVVTVITPLITAIIAAMTAAIIAPVIPVAENSAEDSAPAAMIIAILRFGIGNAADNHKRRE